MAHEGDHGGEAEELGLTLLTDGGGGELERELRCVYTTDLLEPAAFLTGGELVLTSEGWYRGPGDCAAFAASLAAGGAAALVAGDILLGEVPAALVEAWARLGIPVLAAPPEISYSTLSRAVIERINRERGRELAEVLGRHRRRAGTRLLGPVPGRSAPGRPGTGSLPAALRRGEGAADGYTVLPIGRRSAGAGFLVVHDPLADPAARESAEQTA
ncbi:PucR family transcriptional regulator ligand-binding domain-containing protein [Streptomyces sp. NPDC087917]|uniref:PucR family transcriptional regulator ligand-binding domain-containing protein n=1 Tax=Streptomyces sp. NPDC087917 TaxID=3155060 RepID=UPI00341A549A